jgi:acyl carrier protein
MRQGMGTQESIARQLAEIIERKYGRVQEDLMASGLIDSLRAVELALSLEKEFGLQPDTFALSDLRTLSALAHRIAEASKAVSLT